MNSPTHFFHLTHVKSTSHPATTKTFLLELFTFPSICLEMSAWEKKKIKYLSLWNMIILLITEARKNKTLQVTLSHMVFVRGFLTVFQLNCLFNPWQHNRPQKATELAVTAYSISSNPKCPYDSIVLLSFGPLGMNVPDPIPIHSIISKAKTSALVVFTFWKRKTDNEN